MKARSILMSILLGSCFMTASYADDPVGVALPGDQAIANSLLSESHVLLLTSNGLYNDGGAREFNIRTGIQALRAEQAVIQNQQTEIALLSALCKATKGCQLPA